jgi:hypothetical protein
VKEESSDSELRKKLAAWKIEPRLPDDFQRRVWERIAARESANIDQRWDAWLSIRLSSVSLVSRLALAAVVVGLLVGTTTGLIEASRWNSAEWNRLGAKYVQSINPYQRISPS